MPSDYPDYVGSFILSILKGVEEARILLSLGEFLYPRLGCLATLGQQVRVNEPNECKLLTVGELFELEKCSFDLSGGQIIFDSFMAL